MPTFPKCALDDRFIGMIKLETHGEILGDMEVVRIPLVLYRRAQRDEPQARAAGGDHPLASAPVFLVGDSRRVRRIFSRFLSDLGRRCTSLD